MLSINLLSLNLHISVYIQRQHKGSQILEGLRQADARTVGRSWQNIEENQIPEQSVDKRIK